MMTKGNRRETNLDRFIKNIFLQIYIFELQR